MKTKTHFNRLIKEKAKELKNLSMDDFGSMAKYKKAASTLSSEIEDLKACMNYIESAPREEYVKRKFKELKGFLDELPKKIKAAYENQNVCKEDETKVKAALLSAWNVRAKRKQLRILGLILD